MELPRDINNFIVSKLDIDTRRHFGIYTNLKVPETLAIKISNCFNRLKYGKYNAVVRLGPKRIVFPDNDDIDHMYSISRSSEYCDGQIFVCYQVTHISLELNIGEDYFNEYTITSYDTIFGNE